jgi:hypothetical protein
VRAFSFSAAAWRHAIFIDGMEAPQAYRTPAASIGNQVTMAFKLAAVLLRAALQTPILPVT